MARPKFDHATESARAARAAHALLMANPFAVLYVYYKTRRLEAFEDGPPLMRVNEWTLAFPERVPGNLTIDQLVMWFAARTGKVPYL